MTVTNNEVAPETAALLHANGFYKGDDEFERHGIFATVTRPRIEAVLTGQRSDGAPVEGGHVWHNRRPYSQGFDENAEFLELSYHDPNRVARGRAFEHIAPLLWMLAGARGPRIKQDCEIFSAPEGSTYAVLFDLAYVRELVAAIDERDEIELVFIVTDSTAAYQQAAAELPAHVEPVRLYEAYLRNFELNAGGEL